MHIEGLQAVIAQLRAKAVQASGNNVQAIVGFTANYALWVHENIEMKWKGLPRGAGLGVAGDGVVTYSKKMLESGQAGGGGKGYYWDPQGRAEAKFLEGPARELAPELGQMILEVLGKGKTMAQALLVAGLRLQREAMLRVPVDTGNLKNSAFTRIEPLEGGG